MADGGVAIGVAGEEQAAGDEVVGKHLPVILAALLDVEDHDLLNPDARLRNDVELHQAVNLAGGPVGPDATEVEEVVRLEVDVLRGSQRPKGSQSFSAGSTHQTQDPGHGVVDNHPTLLAEAGEGLGLANTQGLGKGRQAVFHSGGANAGEEEDEEGEEVAIVNAVAVLARLRVVVCQGEELGRERLRLGDEVMRQEEKGDQVEGKT